MAQRHKFSPGTFIERDLFESLAFNDLKGFAPSLLIHILGKRIFRTEGRKGKEERVLLNGDDLNITYAEFKRRFGVSKPRLSRAIGQLMGKGFITLVRCGGSAPHDKSVYSLSDSWRMWKPGQIFDRRGKVPNLRGFCK